MLEAGVALQIVVCLEAAYRGPRPYRDICPFVHLWTLRSSDVLPPGPPSLPEAEVEQQGAKVG